MGSVIVFDANGVDPQVATKTDYVKRVIGVPGDTVRSANGNIYVNGRKVNQNYINNTQRTSGTGNWTLKSISVQNNWLRDSGATKVPKGQYFVLGDHRSVSNDGRYWGFVPKSKIDGVVKVPSWTGTCHNSVYRQPGVEALLGKLKRSTNLVELEKVKIHKLF